MGQGPSYDWVRGSSIKMRPVPRGASCEMDFSTESVQGWAGRTRTSTDGHGRNRGEVLDRINKINRMEALVSHMVGAPVHALFHSSCRSCQSCPQRMRRRTPELERLGHLWGADRPREDQPQDDGARGAGSGRGVSGASGGNGPSPPGWPGPSCAWPPCCPGLC